MTAELSDVATSPTFAQQLRRTTLLKRISAEFFATFVFVVLPVGATFLAAQDGFNRGLAVGFVVAALVFLFGTVSGAMFNPATTIAYAIAGRVSWVEAVYFIVAQFVGGIVGALVLYVTLNQIPIEVGSRLAAGTASGSTSSATAIFTRFAGTFGSNSAVQMPLYGAALTLLILTAIVVGVALAAFRPAVSKVGAPLAIGFAYFAGTAFLTPLTNTGINPAQSLAISLFVGGDALSGVWLFILAPVIGAAIAGLIYRGFIVPEGDDAQSASAAQDDEHDVSELTEATAASTLAVATATTTAAEEIPSDEVKEIHEHDERVDQEAQSFFEAPQRPQRSQPE